VLRAEFALQFFSEHGLSLSDQCFESRLELILTVFDFHGLTLELILDSDLETARLLADIVEQLEFQLGQKLVLDRLQRVLLDINLQLFNL